MSVTRRLARLAAAGVAVLALLGSAPVAVAQQGGEAMDYDVLLDRLGVDTPTGAGVAVAQVEVHDPGYGPDQAHGQFAGKTFTPMSGDPGTSGHATTVGRIQYGNVWSMAPEVNDIFLYSSSGFLFPDLLRTNQGGSNPPLIPPAGVKIINNSWIGDFKSVPVNNDAMRRADLVVKNYQIVMTNGVGNYPDGKDDQSDLPLIHNMYNGIAVGITAGTHVTVDTLAGLDGPGRMKPEIVAPGEFTSFATPKVNATVALLIETARTWPGLMENPTAERSEVLKAVVLAGGRHVDASDGDWSNEPFLSGPNRGVTDRPIDDVVGVGTVNVNRSHLIHTGGEQDGDAMPPATPNAEWAGWDLASVSVGQSRFWRFLVTDPANEVSIVATWHRDVRLAAGIANVADFDLELWRVDALGDLVTLVGDDGLPFFAGGNVVSESVVDNLEHLYVEDLAAGEYVLELRRQDSLSGGAWDAAVAWLLPEPTFRPEDVNEDGVVDFGDLIVVLASWGDCPVPSDCPADIDGDDVVGLSDLLLLLAGWD